MRTASADVVQACPVQTSPHTESTVPLSMSLADVCDSYDNAISDLDEGPTHSAVPTMSRFSESYSRLAAPSSPHSRTGSFAEPAPSAELPLPCVAPGVNEAGQSTLFDAMGRPVLLQQAFSAVPVASGPRSALRRPKPLHSSTFSHSAEGISRTSFEPMYEQEVDEMVLVGETPSGWGSASRIRSSRTESNLAGLESMSAGRARFSLDVPYSHAAARCVFRL